MSSRIVWTVVAVAMLVLALLAQSLVSLVCSATIDIIISVILLSMATANGYHSGKASHTGPSGAVHAAGLAVLFVAFSIAFPVIATGPSDASFTHGMVAASAICVFLSLLPERIRSA